MAVIALAADKGSPGVTTAAIALGAVWPRPVLVAECDQAGGDLVYRLPAMDGGMLDPARGLLSLAASARRGLLPAQVWEHTQRLVGGLDVLVGLTSAEQAQSLTWLWEPLGRAFGRLPSADQQTGADVLVDCGRLGANSPLNPVLHQADIVVVFTRPNLEQVAHLRERVNALAGELGGGKRSPLCVAVIADPREFRRSISEVSRIVVNAELPAAVLGGVALDPKGAEMLRGEWGGRLDRSLLIRSAREIAGDLINRLAQLSPSEPPSPAPGAPSHEQRMPQAAQQAHTGQFSTVPGPPPGGSPAGPPPPPHDRPGAHPQAMPPAGHPPAGHAPAQHPPAGHPPAGHPPAGHPPAGHAPAQHPPAGHPPAGHPPPADASMTPPPGTLMVPPPPGYAAHPQQGPPTAPPQGTTQGPPTGPPATPPPPQAVAPAPSPEPPPGRESQVGHESHETSEPPQGTGETAPPAEPQGAPPPFPVHPPHYAQPPYGPMEAYGPPAVPMAPPPPGVPVAQPVAAPVSMPTQAPMPSPVPAAVPPSAPVPPPAPAPAPAGAGAPPYAAPRHQQSPEVSLDSAPPVAAAAPETSNPGSTGTGESAASQPGVRQGGR